MTNNEQQPQEEYENAHASRPHLKEESNYMILLSNQIKQYQEQSSRQYDTLSHKVDKVIDDVQDIKISVNSLERGQKEVKKSVKDVDSRVKTLEKKQDKRDTITNFLIISVGVVGGVIAILYKLGLL